uniref:Uncharacterized protein n=1 Tax=Odontella aurita TaxID=265563 RepID=A0A7S4K145_9STRA|mmetsp:Transcript_58884/g.175204  ORF Transcript_58884/g.175204 Transcript_58884/m.175204 type:complete len:120 (+) Transcript_58884:311-670(+)
MLPRMGIAGREAARNADEKLGIDILLEAEDEAPSFMTGPSPFSRFALLSRRCETAATAGTTSCHHRLGRKRMASTLSCGVGFKVVRGPQGYSDQALLQICGWGALSPATGYKGATLIER